MRKSQENPQEQFGVMLPCEPKDFGKFISSLLGKPQTLEKLFKGVFSISKKELFDIHHLLDQRIHQQNEATLTQVTAKIFFNDDSSVLLNSLEDFEHYNEVRPLRSVGVTFSWSYLIKFHRKETIEKQQIDLTFRSGSAGREILFEDGLYMTRGHSWTGPGGVFLRISHTERTWGLDIESLLSGYIKNIISEPETKKDFVSKHSGKIGFAVTSIFFIGAIIGAFWATHSFIDSYTATVNSLGKGITSQSLVLEQKVDFLLDIITKGAWPRYILSVVGFIVISLIVSIFFGIWVTSKATRKSRSFVLLSKAAETYKKEIEKELRRDWLMFGLSICASVLTGIVSNILFNYYFGKL